MLSLSLTALTVGCVASEPLDPALEAAFAAGDGHAAVVLLDDPAGHPRLGMTAITLSRAEAARRVAAGERVVPDRPVRAAGKPAADTDLVPRALGVSDATVDGSGVVVALIDSGVDDHPDVPAVLDAVDLTGEDDPGDAYGHGTMVAGAMAAVSPGVSLLSARVLGADGTGSTAGFLAAVDWILADGRADVVNVSVGAAPAGPFTEDPLALAVDALLDAGIVVVAAAGNYGRSDHRPVYGGIVSPGTHPGVVTVGAVDPRGTARRHDDRVAAWSSRGPTAFDGLGKPDLVAPAEGLAYAAAEGSTLWEGHPDARADGTRLRASGTSFAAPVVAGAAALLLERDPSLSPVQVKALLEATAVSLEPASDLGDGAGMPNVGGALRVLDGDTSATEDRIEGERVAWGLVAHWDGYALGGHDLGALAGMRAVGAVEDRAWRGADAGDGSLRYIGLLVSGAGLLALPDGDLWGNGILWDGETAFRGGRVWDGRTPWSTAFVQPMRLEAAGLTGPLFAEPSYRGLTRVLADAPDPTPREPAFE